ncbi:pectin acetylesterase-family hydrolase [Meiothermus hypogaeus]|uniref:Esterase n=2 Tax=Meiothermus hypogaeus TaxID=884155 RepID=A0A511R0W0_9DEIN|nr:pectin acetylesterase-family hydrolase [Meiothermus hypogaeus]RIH78733.1 Pectinacetylesterase [Meiothermus hypogaeus]GEM83238.1 hypothetical protein MHY01S_14040 [Meiothermus hypogaeus NBRC 106114]
MQRWSVVLALLFGFALAQGSVQAPAGWQEIRPGAAAVCSDGSPWRFYVAPGAADKVIVNFQGGGACWDAATCNPQSRLYTTRLQIQDLQAGQGVFNRNNPENPFRDWTHVFVPYCTADLHWGNNTARYGDLSIQHKGAVNARQAVLWVFNNIPNPQNVMVTGCSAGGYGSIMWAPYFMRRYPNANVVQLGDAALGVAPASFFPIASAAWGIQGALPSWIGGLEPSRLGSNDLYQVFARAYPSRSFAQYSTLLDEVQIFFYSLILGQPRPTPEIAQQWVQGALSNLAAIKQSAPNFYSYLAPGSQHCIIGRPEFYSTKVGDVSFADWVRKLVSDGKPGDVAPPR